MPSPRPPRGSTQDDVRRHNLSLILRELHRHGPRSRAELTARMGLNRSTIGALVAELAAAGLVYERRPRPGEGGAGDRAVPGGPVPPAPRDGARRRAGRPSLTVTPHSETVYVIAVNLGVRRLHVALVGLGGAVLARRRLDDQFGPGDPGSAVAAIVRTCRELMAGTPPDARCLGMGVAVPAVLRERDGFVRFAPNLGWKDVPLGAPLSQALGMPVAVGNEANLGVIAEHLRGRAVGFAHVIFMYGEVGVGGGVIVGDRLLGGSGGYAGEIGHIVVNPQGRVCRCGTRGCLETELGADAVLRAVGAGQDADPQDVSTLFDGRELPGLDSLSRWLGIGVGMLVNIFNPDIVVLGGHLGPMFEAGAAQVRAEVARRSLRAPWEQVRIVPSRLGNDALLGGAAELAFAPLLHDPLGVVQQGSRAAQARVEW
ncbi:ROK family transcriptional regulator [Allonocardiopsis opalescens]|uniref:Putative NBD/HSP70 family sugar kinase n=1 Tax=Allonocardiopsis opalescens TaxID=1144618 RepID=A0A2T0QAJ0_9ACTN|nr:ROK family transcriptional regulator [Allonocardiopsis opalescens]PRY00908.1 putative NBD/HSP70 family sugar kinase [Allonocardiopsis opalescens]